MSRDDWCSTAEIHEAIAAGPSGRSSALQRRRTPRSSLFRLADQVIFRVADLKEVRRPSTGVVIALLVQLYTIERAGLGKMGCNGPSCFHTVC
jgi:hypothetical protein